MTDKSARMDLPPLDRPLDRVCDTKRWHLAPLRANVT